MRVSSFPARPPLPITAMPIAPSTSVQLSSAGSPRVYLLQSETEIVFAMFANAFQEKTHDLTTMFNSILVFAGKLVIRPARVSFQAL